MGVVILLGDSPAPGKAGRGGLKDKAPSSGRMTGRRSRTFGEV